MFTVLILKCRNKEEHNSHANSFSGKWLTCTVNNVRERSMPLTVPSRRYHKGDFCSKSLVAAASQPLCIYLL